MIIKPRIKGFVCITSHPTGCLENIRDQINHAKENLISEPKKPKRVLVIGASTGYGLSSRVSAAFSAGAETLGVYFERPPKEDKPASAGFYNSMAFQKFSREAGICAVDVNGDAFSQECKDEVIKKAKEMGQFDLVIYSLASPRRTDPTDGQTYRACLKPIGSVYKNKTLDTDKKEVKEVVINPASEAEIESTEKVMGGDDWTLWTKRLLEEDLLAQGCINIAYSYIGPQVTQPIYRNGTIGRAKEHLENCAHDLNVLLESKVSGRSFVSVNKAVVTQASSAIPVVPLYVSILFKIMRQAGSHEGCIEQTARLFSDFLFSDTDQIKVDASGRIRLDDLEMKDDIQQEIIKLWPQVDSSNLNNLTAFEEYQTEFLKLFGFAHPRVNYLEDIDLENPF